MKSKEFITEGMPAEFNELIGKNMRTQRGGTTINGTVKKVFNRPNFGHNQPGWTAMVQAYGGNPDDVFYISLEGDDWKNKVGF